MHTYTMSRSSWLYRYLRRSEEFRRAEAAEALSLCQIGVDFLVRALWDLALLYLVCAFLAINAKGLWRLAHGLAFFAFDLAHRTDPTGPISMAQGLLSGLLAVGRAEDVALLAGVLGSVVVVGLPVGLVWAARRLGKKVRARFAGSSASLLAQSLRANLSKTCSKVSLSD